MGAEAGDGEVALELLAVVVERPAHAEAGGAFADLHFEACAALNQFCKISNPFIKQKFSEHANRTK